MELNLNTSTRILTPNENQEQKVKAIVDNEGLRTVQPSDIGLHSRLVCNDASLPKTLAPTKLYL